MTPARRAAGYIRQNYPLDRTHGEQDAAAVAAGMALRGGYRLTGPQRRRIRHKRRREA